MEELINEKDNKSPEGSANKNIINLQTPQPLTR